jgi:TolB-like protein
MSKKTCLILAFSLLISLPLLADYRNTVYKAADEIVKEYMKQNPVVVFKVPVAILEVKELSDALRKKDVGSMTASFLASRLSDAVVFTVVDRERMDKVVKEIEFSQTGLVDEKSAVQVGKLLQARLLVDGQVSELGENLILTVRLIDVETGKVVVSKDFQHPLDDVFQASSDFTRSLFQSRYGLSLSGWSSSIPFQYKSPGGSSRGKISGVNLGYKILRGLEIGAGYGSFSMDQFFLEGMNDMHGGENKVPVVSPNGQTNSVTRYFSFNAGGPLLYAKGTWSPHYRINIGGKAGLFIMSSQRLRQECPGFPVYAITTENGTNKIVTEDRNIIVDGWHQFGADKQLPIAGIFEGNFDFLISKRVSLNLLAGYFLTQKFVPTSFVSAGKQQSDTGRDGNSTMDDIDIDYNGTFSEYMNYNFSRLWITGERVSVNLSGLYFGFGISVLF